MAQGNSAAVWISFFFVKAKFTNNSQGLGRKMLRHLFDFARERGYASVVLEAPKLTPAFGFYLREGFKVEKEISLPMMPLCMMRRPLD